jgi:hypothetical protein
MLLYLENLMMSYQKKTLKAQFAAINAVPSEMFVHPKIVDTFCSFLDAEFL